MTWKIHSFSDSYFGFAIFREHETFVIKLVDQCLLEIVEFRLLTDRATKPFIFQKRFQYHSHFQNAIIYRFSQA